MRWVRPQESLSAGHVMFWAAQPASWDYKAITDPLSGSSLMCLGEIFSKLYFRRRLRFGISHQAHSFQF